MRASAEIEMKAEDCLPERVRANEVLGVIASLHFDRSHREAHLDGRMRNC